MDKKRKSTKYLKNRHWKSKCLHRLKGRSVDICRDYLRGFIDPKVVSQK